MTRQTLLQDCRLPLAVVPLVLGCVPRARTSRIEPSLAFLLHQGHCLFM